MTTKTYACPFCRQDLIIRVPEDATEEEMAREAINVCNCAPALIEKDIIQNIGEIQSYIQKELSASNKVKSVLYDNVESIARHGLDQITVHIGDSKYVLKRGKGLKIKVEHTTTNKETIET